MWGEICLGLASLATMRAAFLKGDIDEAARQGALAGPMVIEQALASNDRTDQLAGIAAAPGATSALELLGPLAGLAASPDRRAALPAVRAARVIAREAAHHERPDDVAPEEWLQLRDRYLALARDRGRWIELRVTALDVAFALDPRLDVSALASDPDPAIRAVLK